MTRLLKVLVALAVVASCARALRGYGHALEGRLEHVGLGWLLVALAASIAYRITNAYGWVLVLRSLGTRVPAAAGIRLWLVSETLRWLPGSVWSMFSRVARAKAAGIPAVTASLSLPVELLLTVASWTATACAGIALSGVAGSYASRVPAVWIVLSVALLALAAMAPVVMARLLPASKVAAKLRGLQDALRQLRQSQAKLPLLIATMGFYTALCFVNGVTFLAVLRATCDSPPGWLATVGINAIGWLVGFFAFFAPAGLGIREGGMAAMLAPLMPVDVVVVGVLLWRVVQIASEIVCLGGCFAPTAWSLARRTAARTEIA
jgi:hypothetical protein